MLLLLLLVVLVKGRRLLQRRCLLVVLVKGRRLLQRRRLLGLRVVLVRGLAVGLGMGRLLGLGLVLSSLRYAASHSASPASPAAEGKVQHVLAS